MKLHVAHAKRSFSSDVLDVISGSTLGHPPAILCQTPPTCGKNISLSISTPHTIYTWRQHQRFEEYPFITMATDRV